MARSRIKGGYIEWGDLKGFEEIRRSPEAVAYLRERVERVAEMAGDGYESRVDQNKGSAKSLGRATGRVIAVHPKARASNAKHNTLVRLIDQLGP